MPREIRHFTATAPAGTPQANPVTISIAFPPRIVREIYWRVPNGPMGTFGWRLTMGGVQVIPTAGDAWIVANDEHGTWPMDGWPDSGAWQVTAYNTGANPHSVYLAFSLDTITKPPTLRVPVSPLLPPFVPDLSQAGPPVPGRQP